MTIEAGSTATTASDLDLFEAEATGQPSSHSTTIPDKYSGKSVDDLIKMHQNAERKLGQQSQEIGTLRRVSDQLLDLKKPTTEIKREEIRQPVTVDALLADPEKALQSAVASSEVAQRAQRAEDRVSQLEASITKERFISKHKTFQEDLQNPEFVSWTQGNKVRAALGHAASQDNFEAADNLWEMWEEHKQITGKTTKQSNSTVRRVVSGVKPAPSENVDSTPSYSRAKLMEFRAKVQQGDPVALARWNDPTFQDRMHQAYAEGRVK